MRHPIPVSFVSALLLAGCGGSGDSERDPLSRSPELGQEFVLAYGDSIRIEELFLRFTAVSDDSRCPINGICTWEGNARIMVSAMRGDNIAVLELNTHPDRQIVQFFAGYTIELRDLQPYPFAPLQIHLATYKATLVVDGHAIPGG
jgi:hypothetical protein